LVHHVYIPHEYIYKESSEGYAMRLKSESSGLERFLPLTPAVFEILLALYDGDKHGYEIMQEVSGSTEGRAPLLPGTLYRALSRLLEAGLVEESDERPDPELDDERRRYYRLTALGKRVLKAEAARLQQQINAARAKRLIRGAEGA
jgi:DNA-binding PadR family transcriptional regulator